MALGAGTADVVRMVLWMGLKLVGLVVVECGCEVENCWSSTFEATLPYRSAEVGD